MQQTFIEDLKLLVSDDIQERNQVPKYRKEEIIKVLKRMTIYNTTLLDKYIIFDRTFKTQDKINRTEMLLFKMAQDIYLFNRDKFIDNSIEFLKLVVFIGFIFALIKIVLIFL